MDKRKNNGGHPTNGGRKPKIDEIKLIETMDAVMAPVSAWTALSLKVEEGDVQAIKTWLGYRYGLPKQIVEQTNLNVDAGKLTADEIKEINKTIEQSY